ncbi:MAG: YigZ family protein [Canibacter sp.]
MSSNDAPGYDTIVTTVDTEIEISRSRFLTRLARVSSEEDAREIIAQVKAEHPRARHHCTAFVIGSDGRVQRSSDDGEPSGTAGAPMLDALVSAGLSDVVAVVTRYFGGVLLGAGGLTRAYRGAVAEATAAARRQRREQLTPVSVRLGYDVAASLEAEARRRGYVIGHAEYAESVTQTFLARQDEITELCALAQELSSGEAEVTSGVAEYVDV